MVGQWLQKNSVQFPFQKKMLFWSKPVHFTDVPIYWLIQLLFQKKNILFLFDRRSNKKMEWTETKFQYICYFQAPNSENQCCTTFFAISSMIVLWGINITRHTHADSLGKYLLKKFHEDEEQDFLEITQCKLLSKFHLKKKDMYTNKTHAETFGLQWQISFCFYLCSQIERLPCS